MLFEFDCYLEVSIKLDFGTIPFVTAAFSFHTVFVDKGETEMILQMDGLFCSLKISNY